MKKKIYFHENNSKGGVFNRKGEHKLHIKNSNIITLKSPNLSRKVILHSINSDHVLYLNATYPLPVKIRTINKYFPYGNNITYQRKE